MDNKLACLFHPTTVMLVDDNQWFLDSFSFNFANDYLIKSYSNPKKAAEYLANHPSASLKNNEVFYISEDHNISQYSLNIDISSIYSVIFEDFNRFENISVLVVDYAMPNMNGIEFCKKFADKNFKKILLTGEADNQIAVDAFNDGIIDKFILKTSPNSNDQLKEAVFELQQKYFTELSDTIVNTLSLSHFLQQSKFIKIFNKLCQELNIKEYYLIDEVGSMILLDENANGSCLLVRDEEEMVSLYDLASDDGKLDVDTLESLKKREIIPFLITEEDRILNSECWKFYLANKFNSNGKTFYYTVITDDSVNNRFDLKRVKSLIQYI